MLPDKPPLSRRRQAVRLLALLACAYLAVLVTLLALEDRLLYRGDAGRDNRAAPPAGVAVEELTLHTADGTAVDAWWSAPPGWTPEHGALLYCHGNAGNLSQRGWLLPRWQRQFGVGVLLFDYPGYGRSGGSPSE